MLLQPRGEWQYIWQDIAHLCGGVQLTQLAAPFLTRVGHDVDVADLRARGG